MAEAAWSDLILPFPSGIVMDLKGDNHLAQQGMHRVGKGRRRYQFLHLGARFALKQAWDGYW